MTASGGALCVAVMATAGAAAVGWPAVVGSHAARVARDAPRGNGLPGAVLVAAAVLGGAGGLIPVTWLAPALLAAAVAGAALALGRRASHRREAERRGRDVLHLCDEIAGDLAAGTPPSRALGRAASRWPDLAPVTAAQHLGGSVPVALRALAVLPGAADLQGVAAAWQVSERTGAPLAHALAAVADGLREQQRVRRVVASELASARATARLMAVLPLLTLAAGSGAGDPVGFLLGTPAGLGCASLGLTLALAGVAWIESIAGGLQREASWSPGT